MSAPVSPSCPPRGTAPAWWYPCRTTPTRRTRPTFASSPPRTSRASRDRETPSAFASRAYRTHPTDARARHRGPPDTRSRAPRLRRRPRRRARVRRRRRRPRRGRRSRMPFLTSARARVAALGHPMGWSGAVRSIAGRGNDDVGSGRWGTLLARHPADVGSSTHALHDSDRGEKGNPAVPCSTRGAASSVCTRSGTPLRRGEGRRGGGDAR